MSVYKKLQEARSRFHRSNLKKTGWNDYSKYHYFELADFLPTVQEIFKEVGLCGVVSFDAQLASLTITDMEKIEEKILITSPMGSAKLTACHEVQNIGAVETYQRRYLWGTALEIVENDVLDATTGKESVKKPAQAVETKLEVRKTPAQVQAEAQAGAQAKKDDLKVVDVMKELVDAVAAGDWQTVFSRYFDSGLTQDEKMRLYKGLQDNVKKRIKEEGDRRKNG